MSGLPEPGSFRFRLPRRGLARRRVISGTSVLSVQFMVKKFVSIRVNSWSKYSQLFAGAGGCSAVNSLMTRSTLLVGLSLLGFCFCVAAQQTKRVERTKNETRTPRQLRASALDTPARLTLSRPEVFSAMHGSSFTDAYLTLALFNGPRLPASSELGWTGMAPLDPFQDDLPSAAELQQANSAPVDGKDLPSEIVNPPFSPFYYSGEMGVFYGRSSGKFEREIMETYFLGQIGNDKFQITVGGAYGESNVNAPRYRSFKGSK